MSTQLKSSTRDVAADAEKLRQLHVPGNPLVLANAWDPATARMVESSGAKAVATASAALAPVNGYEDHGKLPPDVAFRALKQITGAVTVPVTADLEDGYGLPPEDLVTRLFNAGACGLNIEDTDHKTGRIVDASQQADKIAAIKSAASTLGFNIVINARVDVHFHRLPIEEGLHRAQAYLTAGADCIYPIFLSDISAIRDYVALGSTNILWHPGAPPLRTLAETGVSRISTGPVLFHLMLKRFQSAASALMQLDEQSIGF